MSGQDNDDMECDLLARWASSCPLSLGQRSTDGVELLGCARHARQDAVAVLRSQPPPKARHKLVRVPAHEFRAQAAPLLLGTAGA